MCVSLNFIQPYNIHSSITCGIAIDLLNSKSEMFSLMHLKTLTQLFLFQFIMSSVSLWTFFAASSSYIDSVLMRFVIVLNYIRFGLKLPYLLYEREHVAKWCECIYKNTYICMTVTVAEYAYCQSECLGSNPGMTNLQKL